MPNAFINGAIDRITDNPRPTNASTNKFRSVFHGSLEKVFEGNISSCPMSWIWEDMTEEEILEKFYNGNFNRKI